MQRVPGLNEWHKYKQQNILLGRKDIPACIQFILQRLTKYKVLIEHMIKTAGVREEAVRLENALILVKDVLTDIDSQVDKKKLTDRRNDLFGLVDAKSSARFKSETFKKHHIMQRTLMWVVKRLEQQHSDVLTLTDWLYLFLPLSSFDGSAMFMSDRTKKGQKVQVVVLDDCLFFLQEVSTPKSNSNVSHSLVQLTAHHRFHMIVTYLFFVSISIRQKYHFYGPDKQATVWSLQNLIVREEAGNDSQGIYLLQYAQDVSEMHTLRVLEPKDKNIWIKSLKWVEMTIHFCHKTPNSF